MRINPLRRGRAVAVIGSIAVIGGSASAIAATRDSEHTTTKTSRTSMAPPGVNGRKPFASLTSGELSALTKARAAIAAAASSIATPILDKAVGAGTITADQRTQFLDSLSSTPGPGSGPDGTWTGATGATGATGSSSASSADRAPSAAAQAVFESARDAIQAQVGSIATPVLDAAVSAATITSAQESTLLGLLEHGPLGGPGGPGGGMPGPGGGPGPGAHGVPPGAPAA
ncbi:MAG: hypothetical protein ABSH27_11840 [Solirubrobacteraceae bacterium]